jgi:tRNA-specific adenosine deaminase 2
MQELEYMDLALLQAQIALKDNEIPVGCVFVSDHTIIAQSSNKTNQSLNVSLNSSFTGISLYSYTFTGISLYSYTFTGISKIL